MLPHMDDEAVDRLQQQGIRTVPQLATMPEKDAAALLARVLGTGKATPDVQQVGGLGFAIPFWTSRWQVTACKDSCCNDGPCALMLLAHVLASSAQQLS